MDSYVIRIYRRDDKNPGKIAGQVEFVDREETRAFGGVEELMKILVDPKSRKEKLKPEEWSRHFKKEKESKKES